MRNAIETLEALAKLPDTHRPAHIDATLRQVRSEQLDWCIHDLTPATLASFGMAKLTMAEEAAVLTAIRCLKRLSSASKHLIQEYAESCLGAPAGALDGKKAAIDGLWRAAQSG